MLLKLLVCCRVNLYLAQLLFQFKKIGITFFLYYLHIRDELVQIALSKDKKDRQLD
jgi:hypothetical protein